MSEGHAPITGVSLMVTSNEQSSLPHAFIAVQVTVVVPVANVDPEAGEQSIVGVVPVAVGSVQVAV